MFLAALKSDCLKFFFFLMVGMGLMKVWLNPKDTGGFEQGDEYSVWVIKLPEHFCHLPLL